MQRATGITHPCYLFAQENKLNINYHHNIKYQSLNPTFFRIVGFHGGTDNGNGLALKADAVGAGHDHDVDIVVPLELLLGNDDLAAAAAVCRRYGCP